MQNKNASKKNTNDILDLFKCYFSVLLIIVVFDTDMQLQIRVTSFHVPCPLTFLNIHFISSWDSRVVFFLFYFFSPVLTACNYKLGDVS